MKRSVTVLPGARAIPSRTPLAVAVALALAGPHAVLAAPAGATVVAGQAQISQSGASTTLVRQTSDKAIVDWRSFSIGAGETVQFVQPGSSSVALNRVTGGAHSEILGRLSANGKVFLVNPSGILFGAGAAVDVGSLVASTLNISNDDFLAGRYVFANPDGGAGAVHNAGTLNAARGGTVALLGAQVSNSGTVTAQLGTVGLAAGGKVSLDFNGDGLTRIVVDAARVSALVANGGAVIADGGQVVMSAHALGALAGSVVRQQGVLQARSLVERNGKLVLDGGTAGTVEAGGTLDVSGVQPGAHGGAVAITGQHLALRGSIDARGYAGGGTVLAGGDYQGADQNGALTIAADTTMGAGAAIHADALGAGNGGKVILWGRDATEAHGTISASGAGAGGNGGLVETSGARLNVAGLRVNAAGPHGKAGRWLLDPTDVDIDSDAAASIAVALDANTDTSVASTGSITVSSDITKSTAGTATLALNANYDIIVTEGVRIGASGTGAKLNIDLNANAAGVAGPVTGATSSFGLGAIYIDSSASLITNGGNIALFGQSNRADGYAVGGYGFINGIELNGATLDTRVGQSNSGAGGSISMRGISQSGAVGEGGDPTQYGIRINDSVLATSTGNINLLGWGGEAVFAHFGSGVYLSLGGTSGISSTSGSISVTGFDESAAPSPSESTPLLGTTGLNIAMSGQASILSSGGDINLRGVTGGDGGQRGTDISMHGSSSISAGTGLRVSGVALGGGQGLRIDGGLLATTAGGTLGLSGRGGVGVDGGNGVNLTDVHVNTSGGAGRVEIAGEATGAAAGLAVDGLTLGGAGMTGDVIISALNHLAVAGSGLMIDTGESSWSTIRTAGVINFRPGGVDSAGEPTASTTVPIAVGSGNGFRVDLAAFGIGAAAPARVVIGGSAQTGAIRYNTTALFNGDLTLQNDGAGSAGIVLASNLNTSGVATLSTGGTASSGAMVITSHGLLLHGAQPESNFQLAGAAHSVGTLAASFDTTKSLADASFGDVNFKHAGALTIGPLSAALAGSGAITTLSAPATVVAGDLLVTSTGDLTVAHNVATLGSDIILVTGGTFANPANSSLTPGGHGVWRVYADTWSGEQRGALARSNLYNCSYGASCNSALSGSGFVYSQQPSVTLTATSITREYGDANPAFTYAVSGLVNGDSAASVLSGAYASSATRESRSGAYPIIGSFVSPTGYNVTVQPGTLTVDKAALLIAVDNQSKVYGEVDPRLSATLNGLKGGDTGAVISGLTLTAPVGAAASAGNHLITGGGAQADNYTIRYTPGVLSVAPAPLTLRADDQSKVYGAAEPNYTATVAGLQYNDASAVQTALTFIVPTGAAASAGTHAIAVSASLPNYSITSIPGTLTVSRAPLLVRADDKQKVYGQADPTLTASYSGLQYADTGAVVSNLALSAPTGAAAMAGTHAITGAGASASNYSIQYAPGTLTVSKALMTVSMDDKQKIYGQADPVLTASYSGLQYTDTSAVVSNLTLSAPTGAAATAGTHAITGAGATASNYSVQYAPGKLTVDPAVLVYQAAPTNQVAGAPGQPIGGSVDGFVYGDSLTSATAGSLHFASAATPRSQSGVYAVQGGGLSASNYRFVQAPSNDTALVVLASPVTVVPTIVKDTTFASSNLYERNLGTPRMCVGTGPLASGTVSGESDDLLALEWSRVRVSPNLSNCLGLGQRNSCADF